MVVQFQSNNPLIKIMLGYNTYYTCILISCVLQSYFITKVCSPLNLLCYDYFDLYFKFSIFSKCCRQISTASRSYTAIRNTFGYLKTKKVQTPSFLRYNVNIFAFTGGSRAGAKPCFMVCL